ncbi:hypothetical protein D3C71_2181290 [compost metagenome]
MTVVNDIHDTDEIERKLMELIANFEPEFELVASVIPQFFEYPDCGRGAVRASEDHQFGLSA